MIDVTFDINVAKAFANVAPGARATPCLYQCVLYNVDLYDWGASLVNKLPFRRPQIQNAVSLIGLNSRMIDPTGVMVALTEHPFYYAETGTSWDSLGGPAFAVNKQTYDSPYLQDDERSRVEESLYPNETDEGLSILLTVVTVVRRNLDRLSLDSRVKDEVERRFVQMETELRLSPL